MHCICWGQSHDKAHRGRGWFTLRLTDLSQNKQLFLGCLNLSHPETMSFLSVCWLAQVFPWRELAFTPDPTFLTHRNCSYFFYLCFCVHLNHCSSTHPVMWLSSVALTAVMEAGCQCWWRGKMEKESNTLVPFGGEGRGDTWPSLAIWRQT